MALYKVTVDLLLNAQSEAEACDTLTGLLTERMSEYDPESGLEDWKLTNPDLDPEPHNGDGFWDYMERQIHN